LRWFAASTAKGVPVGPVVAPARDQPDARRSSLLRHFGIAKCDHDRPSSRASIPRAPRRPQMARSLATSCSLMEHHQGRRGCGPSLPDATRPHSHTRLRGPRTLLCRHSLARGTGDEADVSQAYSQCSPSRASHARQRSRPREPAHQLVAGRTLGRVVVDEVLGCPAFIFRTSLSISRQVSHST
jgi:hypothetical protein